jgi:uncharacterized protein (UPF0332 family)
MDGRAFLDVAHDLAAGPAEAHWRSAAGRAYYALFHECLAALLRWGFALPPHQNAHASVRLRFTYSADPDVKRIGLALDDLIKLRNKADYQLSLPGYFSTNERAVQAVDDVRAAIALLDQIDGDVHRRAAAIASIRP